MADPQNVLQIRVAVIYDPAEKHPKPVWFELRWGQVRVTEVCYFWRSFTGEADIFNYSVQTAQGIFELGLTQSRKSEPSST